MSFYQFQSQANNYWSLKIWVLSVRGCGVRVKVFWKMASSVYWKSACIGRWLALQVSEFLTSSEELHLLIRKDPGPATKWSFYIGTVFLCYTWGV